MTLDLKRISICFLAIALAGGCATSPKPVSSPAPVRYALPKTALMVEVQVERANEIPGKYCDFVDLFLPELSLEAPCQDGTGVTAPQFPPLGQKMFAAKRRTTIQGYAVTLKGVADSSRTHDVSFDASWNIERADSFSLTESGVLTGAEMQRADRTAEIILGVISNVAKIGARFIAGAGTAVVTITDASATPWDKDPLKANFALLSTERQSAYRNYWATPGGRTRLTMALRSFAELVGDLSHLDTVIAGGAGASAAATLIAELRKQINERLAGDFLGAKTKDTWNPVYELVPAVPEPTDKKDPTSASFNLFKFSGCGVTTEDIQPIKNTLGALRCATDKLATPQQLAFSVTSGKERAARLDQPDTPIDKAVLYVVRPQAVQLKLAGKCKAEDRILAPAKPGDDPTAAPGAPAPADCNIAEQSSLLAQWGVQAGIPSAGKDYAYTVSLYEATGAVKSIKLSSKAALDKATIDTAFGIATTLLDAKDKADAEEKKKADAAAAAADELAVLTRERQLLDEKAKIKKLCIELGLPNCGSN